MKAMVLGAAVGLALVAGKVCAEPQVSPLEAVHVYEIHTGTVAGGVSLREGHYHVSAASGSGFAIVDAQHGRLISLRKPGGDSVYHWPGIRVVAHRGGVSLGPPENTIPAIAKAISVGADLIEIDIRQTSDGHLVLMHDSTVDRTTNGRGRVSELSYAEIKALHVEHDGEGVIRVPSLSEALQAMKGHIDADLDFKQGDVTRLLRAVREQGMEAHATMHASWERCAEMSRLEPRIRLRPTADYPAQVPDLVRQLRPAMVNFDWHAVTEEAVRETHLAGCLAFVNCLESADTDFYIKEAIRIGADYIQSDRPDRVRELLSEAGFQREQPILGSQLGTPLQHSRLRYPLR